MRNPGPSRRQLLTRAAFAGAAVLAMPGLALRAARDFVAQRRGRTLAADSMATLRAVCARIIPTDDAGPGATEARAAEYIDRALGGALSGSRAAYSQGLAEIDRVAQQRFQAPFARLSPADQDLVLTELQNTPFFNLVRGHTLQGTFGDPIYGGNANFVGWDLIGYPGVRLSVAPSEQNLSTPAKPTHTGAYDSPMFSKSGIGDD